MIAFCHQTKTPISFWCRRGLNPKSLIQPSETLPVELVRTHNFLVSLLVFYQLIFFLSHLNNSFVFELMRAWEPSTVQALFLCIETKMPKTYTRLKQDFEGVVFKKFDLTLNSHIFMFWRWPMGIMGLGEVFFLMAAYFVFQFALE